MNVCVAAVAWGSFHGVTYLKIAFNKSCLVIRIWHSWPSNSEITKLIQIYTKLDRAPFCIVSDNRLQISVYDDISCNIHCLPCKSHSRFGWRGDNGLSSTYVNIWQQTKATCLVRVGLTKHEINSSFKSKGKSCS